jgi:hypothetical protein
MRPILAAMLVLAGLGPATAESLSCRSVNGNVTCSGSGAASCQTVDGQTVCTGGNGAIRQGFGARSVTPPVIIEEDDDAAALPPRLFLDRRGPAGRLTIERDGTRLRLRSDRLSIDRD